jgi:cell division protein FtsL
MMSDAEIDETERMLCVVLSAEHTVAVDHVTRSLLRTLRALKAERAQRRALESALRLVSPLA